MTAICVFDDMSLHLAITGPRLCFRFLLLADERETECLHIFHLLVLLAFPYFDCLEVACLLRRFSIRLATATWLSATLQS